MTDTTQIPKMDVTRAIGVLNAAVKGGMLDESAVPTEDADKIIEAERIIELARQAKVVADQIGASNVPKYQAIMDVLAEAELFLGIGSEPGPASAPAHPNIPPVVATQQEITEQIQAQKLPCRAPDPARDGVTCELPQNHDGPHMGYGQSWDSFLPPDATAVPPAPEQSTPPGDASSTASPSEVPQEPATPQPAPAPAGPNADGVERPAARETWADAEGGGWLILQYGGGAEAEVQSIATGEATVVPVGFLKQRVSAAPPLPPEPEPSPSSPSSLPPSTPAPPSPVSESPPSAEAPAVSVPPTPSPSPGWLPAAAPPSPPPSGSPSTEAAAPVDDTEGDPQYAELVEQVERDYNPSGMPVPMEISAEPDPMPDDLTAVMDTQARRLHSQRNALASRARYLWGLESAKARGCARLRKSYMKEAMRQARAQLGKDAGVTEVVALAETDEAVRPWIERQERHEDRGAAYKTLFDNYTEDVSVLSRDWTMRENESRHA